MKNPAIHQPSFFGLLLPWLLLFSATACAQTPILQQPGDGHADGKADAYLVIDGYYYEVFANENTALSPIAIRYYSDGSRVFIAGETTASGCVLDDRQPLPSADAPYVSIGPEVSGPADFSLQLPTSTSDIAIYNCAATAGTGSTIYPVIVIDTRSGDVYCEHGTARPDFMKTSECPGLADITRPSLYGDSFE